MDNLTACTPFQRPERLAAVRATALLDTLPDPTFDELTRLASLMTRSPFAFATIVDDVRSFWKSSFGLPDGSPRQNTIDESFCQYVVSSEQEFIIDDTLLDARTVDNPSIKSMGVRAWAGFPIFSPEGYVLGSFCVVDLVPRHWSLDDVEVLRTLASCACREIALRAIIDQERELRRRSETLAQTLQRSLIPPSLPVIPGLDVAACYQPAGRGIDVVGDFYDVFQSEENVWNFIIGDVAGKGVVAAKTAALARYSVRASALVCKQPHGMLHQLNNVIMKHEESASLFLTAIYGTVEVSENGHMVRFACAGHAPPVLRSYDGSIQTLTGKGSLIGVFEDLEFEETAIVLQKGDSLILFTDGVNEARSHKKIISENEILLIFQKLNGSAQEIATMLKDAVLRYSDGVSADDIAVLVIQSS